MVRNIKWLWTIVAVMGIAMIGTIYIQVRLIKESVYWVNQKFDREVYAALNNVIKEMETRDQLSEEQLSRIYSRFGGDNTAISKNKTGIRSPHLTRIIDDDITEHVDLRLLDYHLLQNLEKRGIDASYHYGIYSNRTNSFVIMDGVYAVPNIGAKEATPTQITRDLKQSKYHAQMFLQDTSSLGQLFITFPNKREDVFRRTINITAASVFFTLLILFCFIYTIYIIVAQKNLSEMKTDFINNMTHEFKTPIATISLATDSMLSSKVIDDKERVKRFIEIIKQENHRMLSQVEAVLNLAKLDKQDLRLKKETVDLKFILAETITNARLHVEQRGGKISTTITGDPVYVHVDQNHMSNVFHNVLDNANKYCAETPQINVRLEVDKNGMARVDVEDNGRGMTKEQIRHIFDKFYRVPTGNVHDVKGFGLGLSYVKTIVEAHDGHVKVKSGLDQGSTFSILLPIITNT